MSEPQQSSQNAAELDRRRHWLGLPVMHPIEGGLAAVLNQLPHFGRQPFTMASVNGNEVDVNPYLDVVYRVPARERAPCRSGSFPRTTALLTITKC
jgi:hypothetical protein